MFRRLLFLSTLLLLSMSLTNAQNFSFGMKAGGSLVKMNFGVFHPDYKSNYGFSAGISGTYKFNELLSLEADLLFTEKGTKYIFDNGSYTLTKSYSLEYISIPVIAKIFLPVESGLKPHLTVGPSFNFLLNNSIHTIHEWDPFGAHPAVYYPPSTINFTSATQRFDLGIVTGVGCDYKKLSLEARYEFGMTDLHKGPGQLPNYGIMGQGDMSNINGPIKNHTFSILLGYRF